MRLLKILKEKLLMKLTDPDFYLMKRLIELDEKGKRDSLRAKAIIKKLIKRGHHPSLFENVVYEIDEDDEFFEDDEYVDYDKKEVEKLLTSIFGPRKTSNNKVEVPNFH